MVKFSDKVGQTWVDVVTTDDLYNGISLNLVFLTFEDDIIYVKRISTSYYNALYQW